GVASKAALPNLVAQNENGRSAGFGVGGRGRAAQKRRKTQKLKSVAGDAGGGEGLGICAEPGNENTILTDADNAVEDMILLGIIQKLRWREELPAKLVVRGRIHDVDRAEALPVSVRKWLQQNVIDDAEDRRCRANAERER